MAPIIIAIQYLLIDRLTTILPYVRNHPEEGSDYHLEVSSITSVTLFSIHMITWY